MSEPRIRPEEPPAVARNTTDILSQQHCQAPDLVQWFKWAVAQIEHDVLTELDKRCDSIDKQLVQILSNQATLLQGQATMANELADLQAAQTKMAQSVSDIGAAVKALAAKIVPGIDPAAVESLAQEFSAQGDALEAIAQPILNPVAAPSKKK
jgi:hypothetical protein